MNSVTTIVNDPQQFTTTEQKELNELLTNGKVFFKSENFARSLVATKNPSASQMYYVRKLIADTNNYHKMISTSQPTSQGTKLNIQKVLDMFDHARQHLKRPKITLLMKSQRKIRIQYEQDKSRIKLVAVPINGFYGYISIPSGEIIFRRLGLRDKQDIIEILQEFCEIPRKVAILHGQLTGNCCFCTLPLSDPKSLKLGYGPICAGHYRLPYVKINDYTAIGDWMNILEQPV